MYCPICFNDTLKISSSGVVKFTFNGKSKSTSQMFYNLAQDKDIDLLKKLNEVVEDYFSYYSNFQNKDPIKYIEAFSIDFKCSQKCVIDLSNKVNVIGVLFSLQEIKQAVVELGKKYQVPLDLKLAQK
jgi:hypothetical protein